MIEISNEVNKVIVLKYKYQQGELMKTKFQQSMDDVFCWSDGTWIYRYEYYELPEFKGDQHFNFNVIYSLDTENYRAFFNELTSQST